MNWNLKSEQNRDELVGEYCRTRLYFSWARLYPTKDRVNQVIKLRRKVFDTIRYNIKVFNYCPSCTQWAGAYFWLYELFQEVQWYLGHQGQYGNNPQCLDKQITEFGIFEKMIFLCFLGALRPFWNPKNLNWP